jgi:hypothetical protein
MWGGYLEKNPGLRDGVIAQATHEGLDSLGDTQRVVLDAELARVHATARGNEALSAGDEQLRLLAAGEDYRPAPGDPAHASGAELEVPAFELDPNHGAAAFDATQPHFNPDGTELLPLSEARRRFAEAHGNETLLFTEGTIDELSGAVGRGGYRYGTPDVDQLFDYFYGRGLVSPQNIDALVEFYARLGLEPSAAIAGDAFRRGAPPVHVGQSAEELRSALNRYLEVQEKVSDAAQRQRMIDSYLEGVSGGSGL